MHGYCAFTVAGQFPVRTGFTVHSDFRREVIYQIFDGMQARNEIYPDIWKDFSETENPSLLRTGQQNQNNGHGVELRMSDHGGQQRTGSAVECGKPDAEQKQGRKHLEIQMCRGKNHGGNPGRTSRTEMEFEFFVNRMPET